LAAALTAIFSSKLLVLLLLRLLLLLCGTGRLCIIKAQSSFA
jgi:hypothetical protein